MAFILKQGPVWLVCPSVNAIGGGWGGLVDGGWWWWWWLWWVGGGGGGGGGWGWGLFLSWLHMSPEPESIMQTDTKIQLLTFKAKIWRKYPMATLASRFPFYLDVYSWLPLGKHDFGVGMVMMHTNLGIRGAFQKRTSALKSKSS